MSHMQLATIAVFLASCFPFSLAATSDGSPIEPAVEDTEFEHLREYYNYDPELPLDPVTYGEWPWRGPYTLYKVSYRSVREQRVPAYLAIPKGNEGEVVPAVLLLHGWNLFWGKNEDWVQEWISILTAQGYAVLAPDHFLYGERKVEGAGFDRMGERGPYYFREWMCQSVADLRRGIDYLHTRPEIDPERIAILGGSLGGWIGSILSAVEPRIKTTVLTVPGTEFVNKQTPPARVLNASNFFPRISSPLLLVLAKRDDEYRNARAKALFDSVPTRKKLVEYDEGHYLPPQEYNSDILQWLEENL
ncbi:MAG: alpha/beta fold hydrolase [Candidatus Glassbacteria bacterium]|nr:alpha/beta fold hydrolase [Candidatus Glassbacteria bacterium]